MSTNISRAEYDASFKKLDGESSDSKRGKALEHALEIRKFEIELYWKRATYFWAFIGATPVGYGALLASSVAQKADLSVVLACLGCVFAFVWFLVNKGRS